MLVGGGGRGRGALCPSPRVTPTAAVGVTDGRGRGGVLQRPEDDGLRDVVAGTSWGPAHVRGEAAPCPLQRLPSPGLVLVVGVILLMLESKSLCLLYERLLLVFI